MSPHLAIEYVDLDAVLTKGVSAPAPHGRPKSRGADLPFDDELRERFETRGLLTSDVAAEVHPDGTRLLAGPFSVEVGSRATVGDKAELELCLDALAAAVTRKLMIAAAPYGRGHAPQWACTASAILVDACEAMEISMRHIWSARTDGSAPPPPGLQKAATAKVTIYMRGSRVSFEARPRKAGTLVMLDDSRGPGLSLGVSYPVDRFPDLIGKKVSSLVPVSCVPMLGWANLDPVMITAETDELRTFAPKDGIRLGLEVGTKTLDLAPRVAMQAIGLDRPHTDPAEKPWLRAAPMLARFRKIRKG